MRKIFNCIVVATGVIFYLTGCEKAEKLPYYGLGSPVVLSSSASAIAPAVSDSNKKVLVLNWSFPHYATDSSNIKYIIEIDSTGRNFAHETTKVVTQVLTDTFLAKELNNIMISYGYAFNVPVTMDFRITSSYANNNEIYVSNVIKVKITPYLVPPKVVPPASRTLYLVGSATAGGWGNPVPAPAQQFQMIDTVTYEGTFFINGGNEYLFLPVNGDWSHKYAVADKTLPGLSNGGSFGADLSDNFPGPANTGMYKIHVDFQNGKFTVTQVKQFGLLWVPGDYQGWSPATAPTLGSPNSDGNFDGYINIPAGGTYQFKFTTTPDWSNALGDGGGGTLSPSGGNLSVPGAGFYHMQANTVSNTWSATATTWGVIGSFAPSAWSTDVDMTQNGDNSWSGTITTVAGDQFKFRANHDWGLNYGESGGTGSLVANGDNIGDPSKNFAVPAGTHTITLYLTNSGYYTYKIQ